MAYGFEVLDSAGNVMLTTTDRITSLYGVYSFTIDTIHDSNPKVVSAPGVNAGGSFFVITNGSWINATLGTNVINIYFFDFGGTYSDTATVFQM
jgi:hypothetical protein